MWEYLKSWIWTTNHPENLNDDQLLNELGLVDDESEETVKDGIVTELQTDYGLIDNEFYYERSLIPKICERPLQVGDRVQFKAFRKNENQQWKVQEIVYSYGRDSDWEKE